MTTGRVEYSPDYKAETRPSLNVVFQQAMERRRLDAERVRLEREIIRAARAHANERRRETIQSLTAAVDAIEAFESLHGNQK